MVRTARFREFRVERGEREAVRTREIAVSAGVAVAVLAAAFALWQVRVVVALLFLAIVIGSAMRPGVERLRRLGLPRPAGVLCHYLLLGGLIAFGIYVAVPQLLHQARSAVADQRTAGGHGGLGAAIGGRVVDALATWIASPSLHDVVEPTLQFTLRAFAIVTGIAFVLACAAFWTIDRDRIRRTLTARLEPGRRASALDLWERIEQRLGAYVRAQLFLIALVGTILSIAFKLIGLPFWLILGVFAGVVEIIPVVGPLAAGLTAVGVGLTVSLHAAALAAAAVYGLRVLQDYVIVPRVVGHAVDLPPLVTLVSVAVVGFALGPALVPLTTPIVASVALALEGPLERQSAPP
jgi:predicted PurR-regulated permease PerM